MLYALYRMGYHRRATVHGFRAVASNLLINRRTTRTLSDTQRRANDLRADLELRSVHPDVLPFRREELLANNYFHAVLESAKSVSDKLRQRTGLSDDGGTLVD